MEVVCYNSLYSCSPTEEHLLRCRHSLALRNNICSIYSDSYKLHT